MFLTFPELANPHFFSPLSSAGLDRVLILSVLPLLQFRSPGACTHCKKLKVRNVYDYHLLRHWHSAAFVRMRRAYANLPFDFLC
jgi:hypothetical protein